MNGIPAFRFDESDAQTLAMAVALLAQHITDNESNAERQTKMRKVMEKKRELLAATSAFSFTSPDQLETELSTRTASWEKDKLTVLFIEVCFAQPFSPYELQVKEALRKSGLVRVASAMGVHAALVDDVLSSIKKAKSLHRNLPWVKIVAATAAGIAALALTGYVA